MSKTKDYIYLDEDLLNSHLAQFEKGLLTAEKIEHGTESQDSTGGSTSATLGINGILGIGAKLQNEITENDSSVESEFTKNIVENVLSDYAVDLLIEDCNTNKLLHNLQTSCEGDFVLFSSQFQIYDFEYLKDITNHEVIKPILEEDAPPSKPGPHASSAERTEYQKQLALYNKNANSAENGYKLINNFSAYADALFNDSILVTLNGGLAICKRKNIRLSKPQISFENESSRKIKVFGVVSTTKKETHPNGITGMFNPNELDRVPSMMFDIILSNFGMLHADDKIIKPIAIYFEAD